MKKVIWGVTILVVGMLLGAGVFLYVLKKEGDERANVDLAFESIAQRFPHVSRTVAPMLKAHRNFAPVLKKCAAGAADMINLNLQGLGSRAVFDRYEMVGSEDSYDRSYVLLLIAYDSTSQPYLVGCHISSDVEWKRTRLLR